MAEPLDPGVVESDVVRGPAGAEGIAAGGQLTDEVGERPVVGIAAGLGAQQGDGGVGRSGTAAQQEEPMRIRLIIGNQQATATLEDDPATRDLVSLLPVTIPMRDLFGRGKLGPLPRALTGGVEPVFTYQVGQIAYWPPNHDIFIV
jgi:hypothetical protein